MSAGDLATLVEGVGADVVTVVDDLDTVITRVESVLVVLPGVLADAVRRDLDALAGQARALRDQVEQAMRSIGDPAALHAAARAWTHEVAGPVSALAGLATLNTVEVDDYWSGPAATAYGNTLPAQAAALSVVAGVGGQLDTDLTSLADAVLIFWAGVIVALNTLIIGLVLAVAGAATVAGAPPAVATAITAVSVCATTLGASVAALVNLTTTAADQTADLQRRFDDATAFPSGTWPRSTSPISIAVLGDGDPPR